jgi:hypothetical protein
MSKASQIVVLCEDEAHEIFVRRFLRTGWKTKAGMIRVPPYPNGEGSGKKFVKDNVENAVKAFRYRRASTALIVVVDADEESVLTVQSSLDGIFGGRAESEQIIYVIPKWHIETWLAYLGGEEVDETEKEKYKKAFNTRARDRKKVIYQLIDNLADRCKKKENLASPPDSLVLACKEFERIRGVLRSS